MKEWYEEVLTRPTIMTRKDKQKIWKDAFLKLTIKKPEAIQKGRDPMKKHVPKWEIDEESRINEVNSNPGLEKSELRTYYKSIRSKPKGKKATHYSNYQPSEWDLLNED